MKLVLLALSCALALSSVQGHFWSPWYDRDNPSGLGDYENLHAQKKRGYVCGGCKPIAAQCRVKGTTNVFTRWSGTAPNKLVIHCSPTKGLVCVNSQQGGGSCKDYEIRYLCPTTSGSWTSFLDRDDPSGTGDWESTRAFRRFTKNNLCGGRRTMCAQCRAKRSRYPYYKTGDRYNTFHDCNWENGLVCTTSVNKKICKDYEVRFKCPTIGNSNCSRCAKWTSWRDRDNPSGSGDFEYVGKRGHNPCSGREPIDIQCRVKATKQRWYTAGQKIRAKCTPSGGLVCVNRDQPNGQLCKDYEIRFLCP
ncbi:mucin-5AC [Lingula anatina]|uniref:Mucin-5AC n=1 Tax=Lingula anatina TaxID=7574 RepID=A0A1S3IIK3_LINAN|nr:mucin-5AC [Lingula anatina]|eukprot:XP_013398042.1 mucin-5AC [Lingula anatina]